MLLVAQYFFGVSLVRDYGRLFRYNLHRCCHPEAEEAGKEEINQQHKQTLTPKS